MTMQAEAAYKRKADNVGKTSLLHLDPNISRREQQVTGAWLIAGPSQLHIFKLSHHRRKRDSVLMNCYGQLTPHQVVFIHTQKIKI